MQRNAPFITRPLVKPSIKRHELWQLFFSSRIQTDRKRNANAAFGVYHAHRQRHVRAETPARIGGMAESFPRAICRDIYRLRTEAPSETYI